MSDKIRETIRMMLREEVAQTKVEGRLSEGSVDDQIDSLLIQFEERSLKEARRFSLLTLLEADDEAPSADQGDSQPVVSGEEDASMTSTSADIDADKPAEARKPKIDINQFARRTARLVENYDNLLDIPTVILTRAKNFLAENYDDSVGEELFEILERDYGLALEPPDNTPQPPAAAGAGPA